MKPNTPRVMQPGQLAEVAGDGAAPEADVNPAAAGGGLLAAQRARAVVVGGRQLSGMSISVVTPPSAAALVALAKPSHSVRPGSLTWTWRVDQPGQEHLRPGNSATLGGVGGVAERGDRGDPAVPYGHRDRPDARRA